jgi:iron complex outermembrane receptor protein
VERRGTFAAGPFGVNGLCASPPPLVPCIGGPNNGSQSANKMTWRVGLDYFAAPEQMFYGYVATGYKAGGFNDFDPATGGVGTYEPESLTAYELGYKGRITDSLQLNSSAYYYDYSKTQISSLVNIAGNFVIYTRTVPTQIYGWENELKWRISRADMLNLALTAMDSKYERFAAGLLQNVDWSGKSLDKTPSFAATASYSHDWTLDAGGSIRAYIASRYSSSYQVSDFVAAVQYTQDSYTRTDVTLTYTDRDEKYYFQLFAKNLENDVQILTLPGNSSASISEPRLYGVRLGLSF